MMPLANELGYSAPLAAAWLNISRLLRVSCCTRAPGIARVPFGLQSTALATSLPIQGRGRYVAGIFGGELR